MPPRTITSFFKRPSFAANNPATPPAQTKPSNSNRSYPPETSPLTEPPPSSPFASQLSDFRAEFSSSQTQAPPVKKEIVEEIPQRKSFGSGTAEDPSRETSFTSQRVVKDGKEVIISSDGDESDPIESLEGDEFFAQLGALKPKDGTDKKEVKEVPIGTRSKDLSKYSGAHYSDPQYKNTIESLVTATVNDNETEANVSKLRLTLNKLEGENAGAAESDGQRKQLHEGMLSSALGDHDDGPGLQRILDAVRRTEAFDQDKAWSFFSNNGTLSSAPKFPRESVAPGTFMAALREPVSRERVISSGVLDFALTRGFLPDELIIWIFHSVAIEPRNDLRAAYCRIFEHASVERVKSLIRPDDIDLLFQRLGASAKALALTDPVSPDPPDSIPSQPPSTRGPLISVLGLLRGAAGLFADDTQERILMILFRLTLDTLSTKDATVCGELEEAITSILEEISDDGAGDALHRICLSVCDTVRDAAFQSRLLSHTLPGAGWISLLRCRLAVAFLTRSRSPLTEPPEEVLSLKRITQVLKNPRFDVKIYKGKGAEYDYGELGAIVSLLNIAIDSGWGGEGFPSKEDEKAFDADIDALADRIKKIFTSIEDSGVSHLKRTLAKEGLEALHYRVLYSLRSKPRPKKTIFGVYGADRKHKTLDSYIVKRGQSAE